MFKLSSARTVASIELQQCATAHKPDLVKEMQGKLRKPLHCSAVSYTEVSTA